MNITKAVVYKIRKINRPKPSVKVKWLIKLCLMSFNDCVKKIFG